jgi:hypothetical protein
MKDQHTTGIGQTTDELDELLVSLKQVQVQGPSESVRKRLSGLYTIRFQEMPVSHIEGGRGWHWLSVFWSRPALGAFAGAAVVALLLAGTHLALHHDSRSPSAGVRAVVHPPEPMQVTPGKSSNESATGNLSSRVSSQVTRPTSVVSHTHEEAPNLQKISISLPYSDRAIANGTSATVQIPLSCYELASLGFPVGEHMESSRILAEVTLGDDGLPRTISLPLPLKIMEDKRRTDGLPKQQ